jgi:hypothetical protein
MKFTLLFLIVGLCFA